ncbi:MAG: DUF1330 domain-containing protein [Gammaproteobacteria bacterium]|nr:DUF1330 domain-containing protein [Gammaproteobacteria bacterium]
MSVYMIARVKVSDATRFAEYSKRAGPSAAKYGGKYLARGGECKTMEGEHRERNVISVWPNMERALQWYHSPEYQEAITFRTDVAEMELCFVEGV